MSSPNVLLVIMDSVRAANTSLHGHEHETTPFLEEFAERATVYEQARSPGTWSLPSHTSIFTGMHVVEHGVTRARHKLKPGHTIFEELSEDGYETGVFSENTWITDMDVGLKDAFDTVEGARNLPYPDAVDPSNFVLSEGQGKYFDFFKHCIERDDTVKSLVNGAFTKIAWDYPKFLPSRFKSSIPARVYTDLFLGWQNEQDGPWAACVNFMDGHLPYLPDEEHDKWGGSHLRNLQDEMDDQVWEFNGGQRPWWQRKALEGLYDGTIHQMDAQLRRLTETLEERGELDDTLVVITSDHGEGFGEESHVRPKARISGHGNGLHETLLHVPLVVKAPNQTGGQRIDEVSTLTTFPKAVRLAQSNKIPQFNQSQPVLASSRGLEEPMEERASKYCESTYRFNGDATAVYEGERDEVVQYLTWRDHSAQVNIYSAKCYRKISADDGGRVKQALSNYERANVREKSDTEDLDAATQQRLEDLGYR